MSTQCSYLYGVVPVNGSTSFGPIGIDGGDVCTIPNGSIAMVTGPVSCDDFSQLPPQQALQCLAEHQRVLERVLDDSTVVPVKFGTVVENDQQISNILETGRKEFTNALERYTGKVELDLSASWVDMHAILTEIADDEAVVSMKARIASQAEPTMEQRIRLGQLVKQLLDKKSENIARRLVVALRAKWPDIIVNPTRDDSVILNAAVLIRPSEEAEFDRTIEQLNRSYGDRLNFRCVGPLPPYSFATAEVKTTSAVDLDAARRALELGDLASLVDIKSAHRRLVKEYHPDKNPTPDAADRAKEISAAYELLEEFALNFKHTLSEPANTAAAIVRIRSVSDLRRQPAAQAA